MKGPKANKGKITQHQNVDSLSSPGITLFLGVCDAIKLMSNLLLSLRERKELTHCSVGQDRMSMPGGVLN